MGENSGSIGMVGGSNIPAGENEEVKCVSARHKLEGGPGQVLAEREKQMVKRVKT